MLPKICSEICMPAEGCVPIGYNRHRKVSMQILIHMDIVIRESILSSGQQATCNTVCSMVGIDVILSRKMAFEWILEQVEPGTPLDMHCKCNVHHKTFVPALTDFSCSESLVVLLEC